MKRILEGRYPPGEKIPGVREIAEEAAVNPNTVQRALTELESSGLIVTQRTAGRFVTGESAAIKKARDAFIASRIEDLLSELKGWNISHEEMIELISKQLK